MAGANAALKAEALGVPEGMDKTDHDACGVNRIVDAESAHVEFYMPDGVTPRKKFALVGFASSSKDLAPVDDPEWVLCGMNQLYRHLKRRCDLHYEIHKDWNTALVPNTDHAGWLRECGVPILMTRRLPDMPTSVKFPIDRLIDKFSLDYFTSTVAYMLAFTIDYIDQQVEARLKASPSNGLSNAWDVTALVRSIYREYTIGIFGIDLIVGEEYTDQRPCAEFWLGQALARDIAVMIPPQSALLKQRYRYGYEMEPNDLIRDSDLAARRAFLTKEHQKASEQLVEVVGALKEQAYLAELRQLRERGGSL